MENTVKIRWSRKSDSALPSISGPGSQIGAAQLPSGSSTASLQARSGNEDFLAEDLLRKIRHAIQEWITTNRLDHLPEEVAFEQAVSILNSVYHVYGTQERSLDRDANESHRKRPPC